MNTTANKAHTAIGGSHNGYLQDSDGAALFAERRCLKIAIVLDKFLPSTGGQSYFSLLIEGLLKNGHEVHVFATEVETSGQLPYTLHHIPVLNVSRSIRMISYILNSGRIINKHRFDIIHSISENLFMNVYNPHGGVEKAYVRQELSSISNTFYRLYKYVRRYATLSHYISVWIQGKQLSGKRIKRIIAISEMVKEDIVNYYHVSEDKISVVSNSVDLKRFEPTNRAYYFTSIRNSLGIDEHCFVIMFAGHNYRLKGVATLINSLALIKQMSPSTRLVLIVTGKGKQWKYKRLAKSKGVLSNVMFLGPVRDIEKYYAASDLYVHPTYYDTFALTILEALASGLPVITTRYAGGADAIRGTDAGIVLDNPSDVKALAHAIMFFLDEDNRKKAAAEARFSAERFSPHRNIQETLNAYYAVIEDQERLGGTPLY